MGKRAIDNWREKLEFLQAEQAIVTGAQKFQVLKEIEEAKQKIAELENEVAVGRSPQADQPLAPEFLDNVLLAYSNARLAEWNHNWTDPDDPDRLAYYVPPHYAVVQDNCQGMRQGEGRVPKRRTGADEHRVAGDAAAERVAGATEEEVLANLLGISDRLCLSEGPGAGKSIFTRRVLAFLSSQAGRDALLQGKPALAVRWEDWHGSWPDDFHASLAQELEPYSSGTDRQRETRTLAEAALDAGRVVLILDALDQVGTEERIRSLSDFLAKCQRRRWRVRVVMTGRPFAVEQRKSTLLRDPAWRFARIEDFDVFQQYRYLYGPEESSASADGGEEAWRRRDLSRVPLIPLVPQADLSSVDPAERKNSVLGSLSERFSKYVHVADLLGNPAVLDMVRRLAETDELKSFERRGGLYAQTSLAMLRRAAEPVGERTDVAAIERTEAVLAAVACQMMVEAPSTYRLDGERSVARLRDRAARRISDGISDQEWRRVEAITRLTHQSLFYAASHDVLAWHHKGMMEFYCGLHLARNKQPRWTTEEVDEQGRSWPSCGDADIRRAAADPQWHWAFRFAIEMDGEVRDPEVLLASISTLFQTPDEKSGHSRPTELMHRAWSLMEDLPPHEWPDSQQPMLLRGGERIIERFRGQFQQMFANESHPQHEVARELLSSFMPCPPADFVAACGKDRDPHLFLMGSGDRDDGDYDEKPQHPVRIRPFEIMAVPVTRRQYALFDGNYEREHDADLVKYSPRPDCPAIYVSWYDAWCFARWLGGEHRLPTEAEWEYACRAGGDGSWCFGDDEVMLKEYAWYDEDWDKGSTHPVASKRANAWGLYDMHGNVWERCTDWFDSWYYRALPRHDPTGPASGLLRALRGGCWRNSAGNCRSACRGRIAPASRFGNLGFRCALVPSSPDK